jgi:peptide/nickel transport system permease protein
MRKYITRRVLLFVPTLIGVSLVIFLLLRIIPGDVAHAVLAGPSGEGSYSEEDVQQLRQRLGLDKPLYVQYVDWMWRLVRGDLGESVYGRRPISGEIARQLPVTLQLGVLSIIIVWMISIPIGVLAAVKQDSWPDYALRGIAIAGLAMPSFFVGLLVVLLLSLVFPVVAATRLFEPVAKPVRQPPAAHIPRPGHRILQQWDDAPDDAHSAP